MEQHQRKAYWENRFSGGVSLGTVGWLALGESFNTWMYRVRRAQFLRVMRRYARSGDAVLDIGSGTGFYLDRWRELRVASIAGSDLTDAASARLRERYDCEILCFDIGGEEIPTTRRFDVISAMDVLFHIVDDERYDRSLRNIAVLLRPGGILVFSDNFVHHPVARGEHQVSRTLPEIERAFERRLPLRKQCRKLRVSAGGDIVLRRFNDEIGSETRIRLRIRGKRADKRQVDFDVRVRKLDKVKVESKGYRVLLFVALEVPDH